MPELTGAAVERAMQGRQFAHSTHAEVIEAFDGFAAASTAHPGSRVDDRWTELILLAVHATQLEWGAVAGHIQLALAAGATADEVQQVLEIVSTGRASPVLYFGMAELREVLDR